MPANVTNQDYTQQINQAFDALKYASPQQLAAVSQQVQQNPQSPEAMALAMATQYQQEMRQPRPAAPQGTVLQQKLAQLQAANTMPAGLPVVGGNQMAFNQAAAQDPMRGAGIAVAPENTPEQEQRAATGGIVALAQGGQVRGFSEGQSVIADVDPLNVLGEGYSELPSSLPGADPNTGLLPYTGRFKGPIAGRAGVTAKERANVELPDVPLGTVGGAHGRGSTNIGASPTSVGIPAAGFGAGLEGTSSLEDRLANAFSNKNIGLDTPTEDTSIKDLAAGQHAAKKISTPKTDVIHTPNPGSSAERIAQQTEEDKTTSNFANAQDLKAGLKSFFPEAYQASPELQEQMKKDLSTAKRDTVLSSLAQGLGAMLSSRSSKTGSIGEGLMQAASAYEKGSAVEQGLQDRLTNLQMVHEKALQEGDKEMAQTAFNVIMKNKEALQAAKAKQSEMAFGRGTELLKGEQSGQFDLARENLQGTNAKDLQYIKNKGEVDLETIKRMADQQGLSLTGAQGNTIMSGINQEAAEAAKLGTPWDSNTWNIKLAERLSGAKNALSGSTPTGTGTQNPLQPLGGGRFLSTP